MSVINSNRGPKQVPNATDYLPKQARPAIDYRSNNTLVYNLGVNCRVYDVIPCPNVKSIDGQEHDIDCPICHGKGLLDSTTYVESTLGFLNQDRDQEYNPNNIGSTWEEGSAQATFISGIDITYFMKIELPDFSKKFYQRIQRQAGAKDLLRYNIYKVNMLFDKNGNEYVEGTDFEIDGGSIKWLPTSTGAKRPAKGVIYSVNYDAPVTFRAIRAMHSGRYSADSTKKDFTENIQHSEQWLLKLDYLVVKTDSSGGKVDPNEIFAPGE